ncbi:MAG: protease modulator HflC, partial [Gemmatales bacterium]|nr:protease modulator HflC [Gemmatales bacterium]MDW8387382.1 protease modulator HflC [Gemmatales bacterium]
FVDQAEFAYVTQFGAHIATYDGASEAGWHWKAPWPIQEVVRLDRRLQFFDVPTQELLIRDRDEQSGTDKPLPLTFDVYVCWRIAEPTAERDSVDLFVRNFGTLERAQDFLRSQIISRLKVELSGLLLNQLVNTDVRQLRIGDVLEQVRNRPYLRGSGPEEMPTSLTKRAQEVGIDLVDIRLRRFNHPAQVRDEIFAKIREDRKREANNYRLQGEVEAARIRAEGELEARRIRTEAEAERIRLEGQARADASRILNDAHKQAPDFYRTVRMLESYREMFGDDKTQVILSLDHPLLSLLRDLPRATNSSGAGLSGTAASDEKAKTGSASRSDAPPSQPAGGPSR